MIRAAVYGAAGYSGAELLRLLLQHPDVTVVQATSREPGRRLDTLHPGLRGLTDLVTSPSSPEALACDLDAVFFGLPHGCSSEIVDAIAERAPGARLLDLAQDFRTVGGSDGNAGSDGRDASVVSAQWVYGQPELFRGELGGARRVACPGCFATAILLATGPALAAGCYPARIIVDAKTGSSGSGTNPQPGTHHPAREATVRAYKVFEHQHEAEIIAAWARLNGGASVPPLSFVPQSIPLVRGIYACCYLIEDRAAPSLPSVYRQFYAGSPFVRVLDQPPNVLDVRGTNNADLFVREGDGVTVVIAAIDNLVRGAAGQAIQCMNLAFGLAEDRGLRLAAMVV